ncbi:hypothetical protein LAG90_13925 [Marinilongibacter aquaticus]|uniref:hypothetical protein n=1 Tax=Marinilongibacter aquaticus TaxID=2975157 RepID=UPI0021BDAA99|nr:hypothetical protein [Marinilongibacter aquaticus]UBM57903.1 hypothetical protein LAG90_13925 [Marinilongibacter aquaticus]
MQKDDFEKQLKNILREGSMKPADSIWEGISAHLDREGAEEKKWAEKFAQAEIAPKPEAWENIVKALDEKERKPAFFLWFNRYTATGIAALILLTLGWLSFNTGEMEPSSPKNTNAQASDKNKIEPTEQQPNTLPKKIASIENEVLAKQYTRSDRSDLNFLGLDVKPVIAKSEAPLVSNENEKTETVQPSSLENLDNGSPFFEFANSFILKRNKLVFDEKQVAQNIRKKKRKGQSWLGAQTDVSPFDPNIKLQNFERATIATASNSAKFFSNSLSDAGPSDNKSETFAIPLSQPYAVTKAGTGFSIGFDYGKHFNRLFSWQGGLRYYSGNSYLSSNVYSYNHYTGDVQTFLESHYIRQDNTVFNDVVVSNGSFIDNDYKYIMAPLQLAFHLPITDKIELALSSGVSTNFFINNVLDNLPEGGSKLTAKNSSYKLVNFSGIGILKANYMIGGNWQLSVGTNFQQTINSGVKKTEGIAFRPKYWGIGTGLSYHFD